MAWTLDDIPEQHGRRAIITGATGGLGLETATALANAGAEVVLVGRNAEKGANALRTIRSGYPAANVSFERIDLASLADVAAGAARLLGAGKPIDILVNNAGVMALPRRTVSADGFELQFATNYLSHFALTGHLLSALRQRPGARVVSLSSIAARGGAIALGDLQYEKAYADWPVYNQSKLACLMFGFELQRRSDTHGWGLTSVAAHPGVAGTDLMVNGPGSGGVAASAVATLLRWTIPLFGQSAARGALPQLYAATAPEAVPGGYYGPDGPGELRGNVGPASPPPRALDLAVAARLWDVSEHLTAVRFPALSQAA